MGVAGTDGNKIYVWGGEGMSSKLEAVINKDRYEYLKKLEASGEKFNFSDSVIEKVESLSQNR